MSSLEYELPGIANLFASWLTELIKYNNNLNSDLFKNSAVIAFITFVGIIGTFMYLAGLVFAISDWAISHQENGNNRIIDTLKNVMIGFIALISFDTVPVLLLNFTNELCYELSNVYSNNTSTLLESVERITSGVKGTIFGSDIIGVFTGVSPTAITVYLIVMVICFGRVFLANIKRGGILIIQIFVGAIHLFSIPRGYVDAFWSWCRQIIGVCLTAFIQNFLVILGIMILVNSTGGIGNIILSAGVCLAAAEAPRILQQFGLDTSMKANVSQAIYGVSGAMSIIRSFA